MCADGFCVAVEQTIVEMLVIAVIEPELLKRPFEVPVCFSDKDELGVPSTYGCNDIGPVLGCGPFSGAVSPSLNEDVVEQKHCHVAAHSITLPGYAVKSIDLSLAQTGREGIQLSGIGPGGEEWISATRNERVLGSEECFGITRMILTGTLDEIFGMCADP